MLGGSFWVAALRNSISAALMMLVFLLLDRPRFSMKKTVWCYGIYWVLLITGFSIWYALDQEGFVRASGMMAIPAVGIFCAAMSGDGIYLSLYKISFSFFLMSICVIIGVDTSRLWFEGSMWADILIRLVVFGVILCFVAGKFRRFFRDNLDYLRAEMDLFSVVALVVSIMMATLSAYFPADHAFSIRSIIRISVAMFMAGVVQFVIFYLYLHLGKEHSYQLEKEQLEMNEQFLRLQLDLADESEAQAARIRHDFRHHCLLMREYVQKEDMDMLLAYMDQYLEDVGDTGQVQVCANRAVNSILSAYTRLARSRGICVEMEVKAAENLAVRDIDLVAILANVLENAIHGCLDSGVLRPKIIVSIAQKSHKIVIQCRNTCAPDARFSLEQAESSDGHGLGVPSIMKTAARYDGETDFAVNNGMFVAKILLNLTTPPHRYFRPQASKTIPPLKEGSPNPHTGAASKDSPRDNAGS